MKSFLQIQQAQNNNIFITESRDFETDAFINNIWYRGDSYELEQLYKQMPNTNCSFWGSVPTQGMEIRKIHTSLPKVIVNQLVNIVMPDLNEISFIDVSKNDLWNEIVKDNKFYNLIDEATKKALAIGDGAFKISFDTDISKYPILEFYSGGDIEFIHERGRIREIIFKTHITSNKANYVLNETYGFGYVRYKLYKGQTEISMSTLDQTKDLKDVTFDKTFCMAIPLVIFKSDKFSGRGQSVFEGKIDNFDSLDECWSQWIDALRAGRAKTYIPDDLLPRNPNTGELLKPNYFDNRYIQTDKCMKETADSKISTEQPVIPTENYIQTYITALDLCLQGIISPSTLGIDTKKLDNAEAQREKEKTTLYTRNTIIMALSDTLPTLIDTVFKAYNTYVEEPIEDTEVEVTFGEYASPSFEAVVETLSNPNTPMSIESKVQEMWGDTKSEEWKIEEVKRIKEQTGITTMEEPELDLENIEDTESIEPTNTLLNGAQIQSMLKVIENVKAGNITRSSAISIVSSTLGIPKDTAETFMEEQGGLDNE